MIVDRLGRGGMGVVYRAFDPELRRVVALKMLPGTNESPFLGDLLERFAREARSAASLTHPNIITVFDIGQDAGRPFIVMEFIEGETLGQLLKRHARLSLTAKLHMAIDLCAGLSFAHSRGVIHRDIKPANLMITPDGVLKILDFGLARFTSELTRAGLTEAGTVLGTLLYMSPEQLGGRVADARSDLFSVGAVLYELFTGRCPFDADNPAIVRIQILQDAPPAWASLMPDAPHGLEMVVRRAMEKEPDARYQTLEDLGAALKDQARELGIDIGPGAQRSAEGVVTTGKTSDLGEAMKGWEQAVGAALATSVATSDALPTGVDDPRVRTADKSVAHSVVETTELRAEPAVPPPLAHAEVALPPVAPTVLPPALPPERDLSRWIVAVAITAAVLAIILVVLIARGRNAPNRPATVITPTPAAPRPVAPPGASAPVTPAGADVTGSADPATPPASNRTVAPPQVQPRTPDAARPPGRNRSEVPVNPRCAEILERAGLGEPLSKEERDVLSQQCRSEGR